MGMGSAIGARGRPACARPDQSQSFHRRLEQEMGVMSPEFHEEYEDRWRARALGRRELTMLSPEFCGIPLPRIHPRNSGPGER